MSISYANPTSGPSAGGIGWFNFGNLTINPGDTVTGLTGTLNNGNVVTFDLALTLISGLSRAFNAVTVPTYPSAQFGTAGYTGLSGNVAMYGAFVPGRTGVFAFTISNINVKTPGGNAVPNFTVLIADAESTNEFEGIQGQTNGAPWNLFTTVGSGNSPTLSGVGTQNFDILGNQRTGQQKAYVMSTQAPSQIIITLSDLDPVETRQGFSIGFATTHIKMQKYVAGRINNADQFQLDLSGTPNATATTAGNISGIQSQTAEIFAVPGNTYGINEVMAPGSISTLGDYTTIVSAVNATPAGSVPSFGTLPVNFTPILGDDVTYTIYNAIPYAYTKTVDKTYADIGDVLTYTVVIDNRNDFPTTNVQFIDATPTGTTYIGNLAVSVSYTGTNPASGIILSSIGANSAATISWQVQINTVPPIPTPIINLGDVIIPGGNSGMTNMVTTDIRTAYVTVNKTVDKLFAKPGDILTYTLSLNNAGNVAAYNVVITDAIPNGTTFIPGTVTGATGIPPTLTLNTPLGAGSTVTVSYQVKIDNTVPVPNPILNRASLIYDYTVDPTTPSVKTKTAKSNTVETLVSIAMLSIVKSADKTISYIGDTITYKIAVKNTGNVAANNVIVTDLLNVGTMYVPGSLVVNVPYTGNPDTAITITNPIPAGQTISILFQVKVINMPNPNPILNLATVAYTYTVNPQNPDGETGTEKSNTVRILVFRNHFGQQINDLIQSVAKEQAALAAIANAEGAKIQRLAATSDITPAQLLCLNKSVSEMINSIEVLEIIFKQKLSIVSCQIDDKNC